jgi:hypothetical protein
MEFANLVGSTRPDNFSAKTFGVASFKVDALILPGEVCHNKLR